MTNREIIFGVVKDDRCASVWKLKANKNSPDVYLSSDRLGSIHASMHKDGRWHYKFGKIQEKKDTSAGSEVSDAYIDKWQRPEETKPRLTIAFRIHTPHHTPQKKKALIKKTFVEIPGAEKGFANELTIFFVAPKTELNVKGAQYIGSINLSNGETVVAVYKTVPINMPQDLIDKQVNVSDFTSRITFKELIRGNLGTVIFATASDGSKMLYDVAIKIKLSGYIKLIWKKFLSSFRRL